MPNEPRSLSSATDHDGRFICGAPLVPAYPDFGYVCSSGGAHGGSHHRQVDTGPFRCGAAVRPDSPEVLALRDEAEEALNDLIQTLPSVPLRPGHEGYDEGFSRRLTNKSQARFDAAVRDYADRLWALGDTWARFDFEQRWTF